MGKCHCTCEQNEISLYFYTDGTVYKTMGCYCAYETVCRGNVH